MDKPLIPPQVTSGRATAPGDGGASTTPAGLVSLGPSPATWPSDPIDPGAPVVLERAQRLSRSVLWKLQRAYFEQAGIDAWRKAVVPHYITSNPFVAATYARLVVGFLRDLAAAGHGGGPPSPPLTILELGAGSGRFAYHFLQKLLVEPRLPLLAGAPVRYVMTDVAPANLAFWRAHPQLRSFFDAGVLDVALFDAERDEALHLQVSRTTLGPGSEAPLVVIANYVFDGLPQDAYRLEAGRLLESRVTLTAPGPVEAPSDPALLDRLDVEYEHVPVEGALDLDPDFRFLVEEYRDLLGEGAFQLPTASLSCVRALARIAGGGLLLLSADKGYCHEEELLGRPEPEIARHGSVSLSVDYHAVRRCDRSAWAGRRSCRGSRRRACASATFLIGAPGGGAETTAAFSEASGFGPDEVVRAAEGRHGGVPGPGSGAAPLGAAPRRSRTRSCSWASSTTDCSALSSAAAGK